MVRFKIEFELYTVPSFNTPRTILKVIPLDFNDSHLLVIEKPPSHTTSDMLFTRVGCHGDVHSS